MANRMAMGVSNGRKMMAIGNPRPPVVK